MDIQDKKRYVDVDSAVARVRGNKKLYRKMLQLFLQSSEFASFEESLAANDIARAAEVVHGIKGMTGNLSLPLLYEQSTKLMDQMRGGIADEQEIEYYREILSSTQALVEQVAAEIDAEEKQT